MKKNTISLRLDESTKNKLEAISKNSNNMLTTTEIIENLINEEFERQFLNYNNDYIAKVVRMELSNILKLYWSKEKPIGINHTNS